MPQKFKLINVDKREITRQDGISIEQLLRVPSLRRVKVMHAELHRMTASSRRALDVLPQEVTDAIIEHIDPTVDAICLALTSRYFSRLVLPITRTVISRLSAPWAGDRIVRIGDRATREPHGFPESAPAPYNIHISSPDYDRKAALAACNPLYAFVPDGTPMSYAGPTLALTVLDRYLPPHDLALPRRLLKALVRTSKERGGDVLRCLDDVSYARASSLSQYRMGEALEMHTTWSTGYSFLHPRYARGGRLSDWPGLRFDIVGVGEADFRDRKGWTDVSKALRRSCDL